MCIYIYIYIRIYIYIYTNTNGLPLEQISLFICWSRVLPMGSRGIPTQ